MNGGAAGGVAPGGPQLATLFGLEADVGGGLGVGCQADFLAEGRNSVGGRGVVRDEAQRLLHRPEVARREVGD